MIIDTTALEAPNPAINDSVKGEGLEELGADMEAAGSETLLPRHEPYAFFTGDRKGNRHAARPD